MALKLPEHFVGGYGLPADILTNLPATYFRNATLEKPVLIVANTGDDEEQSLKEFIRIGAPELQEHPARFSGPHCWRRAKPFRCHAFRWWEKAITGLQELRVVSLECLAAYILKTREAVLYDGLPILRALGSAQRHGAPRPSRHGVFQPGKGSVCGHASAWKAQYNFVARNRGCYLLKQTPSQLYLGEDGT